MLYSLTHTGKAFLMRGYLAVIELLYLTGKIKASRALVMALEAYLYHGCSIVCL